MDCNPPGSSVYGILQARILEKAAVPSSRESSHQLPKTYALWLYDLVFDISFLLMEKLLISMPYSLIPKTVMRASPMEILRKDSRNVWKLCLH